MGFRLKLIISYATMVTMTLLLSLLLFALLAQQIQQSQREAAKQRLSRQTLEVQNQIRSLCPPPRPRCTATLEDYRKILLTFSGLLDARILLVDEHGVVQADTNAKENLIDKILPGYTLVAQDNMPHPGFRQLNEVNYIYYALPGPALFDINDPAAGSPRRTAVSDTSTRTDLLLSVPEATLDTTWNNLVGGLLLTGLLVLSLSVVAAVLIARGVARPLIRMTRASEAIAQGDYSQQLPVSKNSGKDEMGRLAMSFNRMAREVARSQQTMRDFVANVSHELKTPLTSIQGFSQAILDGTADDRALLDHSAAVINHEAARMRRLVDELLDLSRIESGQIELARRDLDLQKLLERVATKLAPQAAEKQIVIYAQLNAYRPQLDISPNAYLSSGPLIMGDSDRLEQIFTNILDNAIKYSPAGGEVSLRLRLGGAEAGKASSGERFYWALIEFSNRGPYIPPDQLNRIFERFYKLDKSRARRKGDSTGLGLAIAKELIEAHRGMINVTSQPLEASSLYPAAYANQQEGLTIFTISLPLLALPSVSNYQPVAQG